MTARTPEQRKACLRLILICIPDHPLGSVAYWDMRTSGNDARAALSMAMGAPPNDVDPALGTWAGPAHPRE